MLDGCWTPTGARGWCSPAGNPCRPVRRPRRPRELGALHRDDAVELVTQVLTRHGVAPPAQDAGTTPEEVTALVEAVGCHARALVLLARETARAGGRRDDPRPAAADGPPGAGPSRGSGELPLRQRRAVAAPLPPHVRGHVSVLAACHGGIHLGVLAELTGLGPGAARDVGFAVIEVGLGEALGDGCLGLTPGWRPTYAANSTPPRWMGCGRGGPTPRPPSPIPSTSRRPGMRVWAAGVTLRQLPELLALLDWAAAHQRPEQVVPLAAQIETLVQNLGQPRALAHAARTRTEAAARLGGWSHARYVAAATEIDRLLDQGHWPAALAAAQQLLAQAETGGVEAYRGAAYDLAFDPLPSGAGAVVRGCGRGRADPVA